MRRGAVPHRRCWNSRYRSTLDDVEPVGGEQGMRVLGKMNAKKGIRNS